MPQCPICKAEAAQLDPAGDWRVFDCPEHETFSGRYDLFPPGEDDSFPRAMGSGVNADAGQRKKSEEVLAKFG